MSVLAEIAVRRSGLEGVGLPVEGVRLISLPPIVERVFGSRVAAMTLGRTILVRPGLFDRVIAGDEPELLAHELIHVSQWADTGVGPFLSRYLYEYCRLRSLGVGHDAAYRGIGFEYAAYVGAAAIVDEL